MTWSRLLTGVEAHRCCDELDSAGDRGTMEDLHHLHQVNADDLRKNVQRQGAIVAVMASPEVGIGVMAHYWRSIDLTWVVSEHPVRSREAQPR